MWLPSPAATARIAASCSQLARPGASDARSAASLAATTRRRSRVPRARLCFSSARRLRNSERDDYRAQADLFAVGERARTGDTLRADVRAVLAAEILDRRGATRDDDTRMVTGDATGVDPHGRVGRAADDV